MKMCEQQGLHQVDLLSPAKTRISDKEYRAKQRGQKKLDELNDQIVAAKMKPAVTVFQTQKQFLRDAIMDSAGNAATMEDFKTLLKEKYGIEVKERRGRFSYLHPERSKFITGRALGSDFEKEHVEQIIKENTKGKNHPVRKNKEVAGMHNQTKATQTASARPAVVSDSAKAYDPLYDYHADPIAILYVRSHLRLVVDLQTNIKAQQSAAYARKVKLSNLKEMALTVVYIQEHGYDTVGDLQKHRQQISGKRSRFRKHWHRRMQKSKQSTNRSILPVSISLPGRSRKIS